MAVKVAHGQLVGPIEVPKEIEETPVVNPIEEHARVSNAPASWHNPQVAALLQKPRHFQQPAIKQEQPAVKRDTPADLTNRKYLVGCFMVGDRVARKIRPAEEGLVTSVSVDSTMSFITDVWVKWDSWIDTDGSSTIAHCYGPYELEKRPRQVH